MTVQFSDFNDPALDGDIEIPLNARRGGPLLVSKRDWLRRFGEDELLPSLSVVAIWMNASGPDDVREGFETCEHFENFGHAVRIANRVIAFLDELRPQQTLQ